MVFLNSRVGERVTNLARSVKRLRDRGLSPEDIAEELEVGVDVVSGVIHRFSCEWGPREGGPESPWVKEEVLAGYYLGDSLPDSAEKFGLSIPEVIYILWDYGIRVGGQQED